MEKLKDFQAHKSSDTNTDNSISQLDKSEIYQFLHLKSFDNYTYDESEPSIRQQIEAVITDDMDREVREETLAKDECHPVPETCIEQEHPTDNAESKEDKTIAANPDELPLPNKN